MRKRRSRGYLDTTRKPRLVLAPTSRTVQLLEPQALGIEATAELLGQQATVFPSHHGGFLGGEYGYTGEPEALARKLREVLDHDN
jgi:hypothetical protein